MKLYIIYIDFLMTLGILLSMSYMLFGEKLHEIVGIMLLILFVIHNILNKNWYKSVFKKKSKFAWFQFVINIMLIVSIALTIISGIFISKYLFLFLDIPNFTALARRIHLICSYWSYILVAIHLGLHLNMIKAIAVKKGNTLFDSKIFNICSIVIAIYGIYACFKNNIFSYMTLKMQFAFFGNSFILFIIDYIAIMWLWAFVGDYFRKICNKR